MSGAVLIADGHTERAQRIGEACQARGFATSFAANGALALETALADVPDVIVAPLDLALIDARKLAEILRANPRAQGVRFVFLGRSGSGNTDYFDEVLPPSSDPDEVAIRVEALLAQRARVDNAWRESESDRELQGRLSQIPLTDLLQLFHMNRRTGTIQIGRREAGREERGTIWLRDGNLIQAATGSVEGEKALFRLLNWRDGSFSFSPDPVTVAPRILTPTRALLMEGMRQLDEWDRLRGSLPPLDGKVTLLVKPGELPHGVHPLTQEVLLLLEIYDRVRDVVDRCAHPDYQVLRTLQTLIAREMVTVKAEATAALAERGEGLFAPAQVRRLREWLQVGRPRGAEGREAKLLLVSPDPDVTRDFAKLLAELAGVHVEEAFLQGTASPLDVAPMAQLAVDAGLSIQLLHVPASVAFAPAWSVLAHASLGTLLLLPATDREAEEAIGPVAGILRAAPRSRLFHLLVTRKDERVVPQELQEKMARLGDASLFLLPLESGKESGSLLRTMFGRVIP